MKGRKLAQDQAAGTSITYLPRAELPPFIKPWLLFVIITEFILLHWGFPVVQEQSVWGFAVGWVRFVFRSELNCAMQTDS